MKVTLNFLRKNNACLDGIEKFKNKYGKSAELKDIINYSIHSENHTYLQYCNWLIVRIMNHKQKIQYAIFAAEAAAYAARAADTYNKTLNKILRYGLKILC